MCEVILIIIGIQVVIISKDKSVFMSKLYDTNQLLLIFLKFLKFIILLYSNIIYTYNAVHLLLSII